MEKNIKKPVRCLKSYIILLIFFFFVYYDTTCSIHLCCNCTPCTHRIHQLSTNYCGKRDCICCILIIISRRNYIIIIVCSTVGPDWKFNERGVHPKKFWQNILFGPAGSRVTRRAGLTADFFDCKTRRNGRATNILVTYIVQSPQSTVRINCNFRQTCFQRGKKP